MSPLPRRTLTFLLSLLLPAAGVAQGPGGNAPQPVLKAEPFDLAQVRLLPGPFQTAQELDHKYLLSLEPDRLLLMFRVNAGFQTWAKALGGWESPGSELRGHTLGHYLSACSLMYASTGDPELKARTDRIVAQLAECQAAAGSVGYHPGYLAAFPESFFDRNDAGKPVWAPWYTMHKIMAGLLDVRLSTGNPQALAVLERLADWVKFRVDRLSPAQMQASLKNEYGGMNEVLANLAGLTGNRAYLRVAEAFNQRTLFDPLARDEDRLDGLHANTQIPKMIGAARQYELSGNLRDREIARFFWQEVAEKRSYAIGGDSDDEHFFPVKDFARHLTPVTAETCNTYNMLKLTKHVFAWDPQAATMDFYERALYNHILASQDHRTGMFAYFISMEPGHFMTYSTPEDSFWCCVGTGMENHARYGEQIYSHHGDALWVNLFIPSQLTWTERGITVRQETEFPDRPASRLILHAASPARWALKIRRPDWCAGGMTLMVNGQSTASRADASGYVTVERVWHDGDRIDLALPTPLRLEELPGDPQVVAIFAGPVVLAGKLGTDGMPVGGAYAALPVDAPAYSGGQQQFVKWPAPPVPPLGARDGALLHALEPVRDQPLTYRLTAVQGRPIELVPFFRLQQERYTVYWRVPPTLAAAP